MTLDLDSEQRRLEPRFDGFGRYLIKPADGGKQKAYTRATTWAKALDDEGGLINWSMRMCALGLVIRKDLFAQVAAARKDDQALRHLVDEAKDAGGGSEGANIGEAEHKFTERVDLGEDVAVPDAWRADIDAYKAVKEQARLTIRRDLIERVVVVEKLGVAGKFDRVYVCADGGLVIGDVKTAQSLNYSKLAISVQLALYAHADTIYDLATETHAPMVDVRKDVALVVHMPSGQGRADIYEVDIAAGWEYVQLAGQVRAARARGKRSGSGTLFRPYTATSPDPQPIGPTAQLVAYRAWILGRLDALKANREAVVAMRDAWPAGVPGTAGEHTEEQLDLIAAALADVEDAFSMPFPVPDPRTPPRTAEPEPVAAPAAVDEGPPAAGKDVLDVLAKVDALPAATRMVLNGWAAEAHAAGVSFSIRLLPSQRRLAIYRALLALAPLAEDWDVLRGCFYHTLQGFNAQMAPLGVVIGHFTTDQAVALADTATGLTTGRLVLHYRDDGTAYLTQPNQPESNQP